MSVAIADPKVRRIIADFPILQRPTSRGKRLVYLDSAATSQKPQVVIDALVNYYSQYNANIHRGVYEIADAILVTQLEHHSNLVPWQVLAEKTGAELRFIPVDDRGLHVRDDLDALLDSCKLVALSHVSNSLGTIAPLDIIIPRAHAAGALVMVDGAQAAPNMPVDLKALDADFYAFSAHKMCGPTGIGVLYGKRALLEGMPPFLTGGDMIRKVEYTKSTFNELPWKFEAGTSNVADAIAFAVAVDYLRGIGMEWVRDHEHRLVTYALERLATLESRGLAIYGPRDPARIADVISFNFGDVHPHDLASILDTDGVCVRAGHHCTMPLMEKMGWPATARASFYIYNTEEDIDALVTGIEKAARVFKL